MAQSPASDGAGFRQDVRGLGQGLDTLKTDVGNLARGAVDAARSGTAELREGAQDAVAAAKDSAVEAADSLKSAIGRNPLASIGIAAGVGVLIGMIMCRPRS